MNFLTRAEKATATRRAKRLALWIGGTMAAVDAIATLGMLSLVIPHVQRTYLAPAGWPGLYEAIVFPGSYLFLITIGLVMREGPHWMIAFAFLLNGVGWYVIARAAIWCATEIRATVRPR